MQNPSDSVWADWSTSDLQCVPTEWIGVNPYWSGQKPAKTMSSAISSERSRYHWLLSPNCLDKYAFSGFSRICVCKSYIVHKSGSVEWGTGGYHDLLLRELMKFSRRYAPESILKLHPTDLDLWPCDLKVTLPFTLYVGNLCSLYDVSRSS